MVLGPAACPREQRARSEHPRGGGRLGGGAPGGRGFWFSTCVRPVSLQSERRSR